MKASKSTSSLIFTITLLLGVFFLNRAFAQTSGPTQVEYQSYGHKEMTEMVNLFTGDLNYNIPLFELPGPDGTYPFVLTYNSGVTMNQEASWVGLGWNLSPGVISRQIRGIPDDFKGENINLEIDRLYDLTLNISESLGDLEIWGIPLPVNFSRNYSYNSYRGFNTGVGLGISITHNGEVGDMLTEGFSSRISGGANFSSESGSTLYGSVSATVSQDKEKSRNLLGLSLSSSINSLQGVQSFQLGINLPTLTSSTSIGPTQEIEANRIRNFSIQSGSIYQNFSFGTQSYTPSVKYDENSWQLTVRKTMGADAVGVHPNLTYEGSFLYKDLAKNSIQQTAFGYLYLDATTLEDNVILDFNKEKETLITDNTENLPTSHSTYDLFNVSGNGIGGTFRAYRNEPVQNIGNPKEINSQGLKLGSELGGGYYAHLGLNIGYSGSKSNSDNWEREEFDEITTNASSNTIANPMYEPYYFKFIGEHTSSFEGGKYISLSENSPLKVGISSIHSVDYLEAIRESFGQIDLPLSLDILDEIKEFAESLVNTFPTYLSSLTGGSDIEKKLLNELGEDKYNKLLEYLQERRNSEKREPRKTLIQSFTNKEVKEYQSIFPELRVESDAREANDQIGAFIITNPNGVRYVYALPVYNHEKIEYTSSVASISGCQKEVTIDAEYDYQGIENSEKYKQKITTGKYAYAWQLTQIIGADYVDLGLDGPSDDDLGYWMKFGYQKVADDYKWRAPFSKANALKGFENSFTVSDDKGSINYGTKEVWYLNRIESRTHIATFHTSARNDGKGANDMFQTSNVRGQSLQKLDFISVAAKDNSVPIKQIHFGYSYDLVPQTPNAETGKLTLDSLYFTYQNNNRGRRSPYKFEYSDLNPSYDLNNQDRWGMYRAIEDDCRANSFPYTSQLESERTELVGVSAWHLDSIQMPSGGGMKIDYEADTYAYVQDQPAMQMTAIKSFYDRDSPSIISKNIIYFELNDPENTTEDEVKAYVDNLQYIYFKVKMNLKTDEAPLNKEYVSGYMEIDKTGTYFGLEDGMGWVKIVPYDLKVLRPSSSTSPLSDTIYYHPISVAAWQHMRTKQPELIYKRIGVSLPNFSNSPSSTQVLNKFVELGSDILGSIQLSNFNALLQDYYGFCNSNNWGGIVDLNEAWIRLKHPTANKVGGGNRVKKITMSDNWVYDDDDPNLLAKKTIGLEFNYNKLDGTSSGVASYEPMVGNDENPLRNLKAINLNKVIMGSDYYTIVENPMNESQFPAPVVGYSRVEVKTSKTKKVLENSSVTYPTTGITVHEFYTAKDKPIITKETALKSFKKTSDFFKKLLANEKLFSASQGYSIVLNDWHGKPKTVSQFATSNGRIAEFPLFKEVYEYTENPSFLNPLGYDCFEKKDCKTAYSDLSDLSIQSFSQALVKTDLTFAFERSKSSSLILGLGGNIELSPDPVFATIPLPIPILLPGNNQAIFETRIASANKVISKGAIPSRTITTKDGIVETKSILGYDAFSGMEIHSSTDNNFNDLIYSINYPAYWVYRNMGPAYINAGAEFPIKILETITNNH